MERLRLEQLARLVGEPPTPKEQAALDANPALRRELEALRAQTAALGALPDVLPPPNGWKALRARLAAAGLLEPRADGGGPWRKWIQAAAALVLFTGGTAFGWTVGAAPDPEAVAARDMEAAGSGAGTTPAVAMGAATPGVAGPSSLNEARAAVRSAEEAWAAAFDDYQRFLGARDPAPGPRDPASRLAAVETIWAASRAAVEEAPADPVFNEILVTMVAERQQLLRSLSRDGWH